MNSVLTLVSNQLCFVNRDMKHTISKKIIWTPKAYTMSCIAAFHNSNCPKTVQLTSMEFLLMAASASCRRNGEFRRGLTETKKHQQGCIMKVLRDQNSNN